MVGCLVGWSVVWLLGCLIVRGCFSDFKKLFQGPQRGTSSQNHPKCGLVGWLVGWLVVRVVWLVDWLVGGVKICPGAKKHLIGRLVGWSVGWWLVGWFVRWPAGSLVGRLVGCLVG